MAFNGDTWRIARVTFVYLKGGASLLNFVQNQCHKLLVHNL